jgi:hypothetical protein
MMAERTIVTVMTAVVSAAWVHYFAVYLRAPTAWQWLALPVAFVLGGLMWWRYSGGRSTESAFAEEVPAWHRYLITAGMIIVGFVGGFIVPPTFGANDAPLALELALGASLAALFGWIAWSHPALFYKNRQF